MRFLTIYTFLKHNPDWEIRYYYPKFRYPEKTWTTFELKYDISKAKDYITELRELPIQMIELDFSQYLLPNDISEVFKSDLLRWNLLSTIGGMWSDMDILYFRPMTTLLNNTKENSEVDTGITINDTYGHSIGFLLSAPNNLYYDHIIKHTSSYFNPKNYQCLGTTMLIKEVRTMSIIAEKFPTLTIANIDNNAVYAYNASMIKSIYNSESLTHFTPHSIGLHWYAGHPLSGEFLNVVTEENYLEYTNVIGSVLNFSLNQTECGINLLLNKGIK
jgi:mannosyltransferase OCH1-like enzyme